MPFLEKSRKRLLWYLAFGVSLPWLAFLVACIRYGRLRDILDVPGRLFGGGYNYFAIGCLNMIPFVLVAAMAILDGSIRKRSRSRQFGIAAAAIVTIILDAMYQTALWFDMMGPHPDSLIGLSFVIFPALITGVSFVTGGLAWAISAVVISD